MQPEESKNAEPASNWSWGATCQSEQKPQNARMNKGMRVACIDDRFPKWITEFYDQLPVKGSVYTIREVCLRRETLKGSESATIALLLEELHNASDPTHSGGEELAFKSERFAPLEEEEMEEREVLAAAEPW
jgi:hypothetical protein